MDSLRFAEWLEVEPQRCGIVCEYSLSELSLSSLIKQLFNQIRADPKIRCTQARHGPR